MYNTHSHCCSLTEEVVVGVPLILEGESPKTEVVEVFEPLKVRHSHTTCIGIQVLGRVGGGVGKGERDGEEDRRMS